MKNRTRSRFIRIFYVIQQLDHAGCGRAMLPFSDCIFIRALPLISSQQQRAARIGPLLEICPERPATCVPFCRWVVRFIPSDHCWKVAPSGRRLVRRFANMVSQGNMSTGSIFYFLVTNSADGISRFFYLTETVLQRVFDHCVYGQAIPTSKGFSLADLSDQLQLIPYRALSHVQQNCGL